MEPNEVLHLVAQLIEQQQKQLLALGRRSIPQLTPDDLLQPNDYPELELNPYFRYEEGVLHGLQVFQAALLRELQDCANSKQ